MEPKLDAFAQGASLGEETAGNNCRTGYRKRESFVISVSILANCRKQALTPTH